jgi:hypothetical protein
MTFRFTRAILGWDDLAWCLRVRGLANGSGNGVTEDTMGHTMIIRYVNLLVYLHRVPSWSELVPLLVLLSLT